MTSGGDPLLISPGLFKPSGFSRKGMQIRSIATLISFFKDDYGHAAQGDRQRIAFSSGIS